MVTFLVEIIFYWKLLQSYIEDVQRKNYRRKLFNEQAGKLLSKYPDSRDDISRHVSHLNAKWELIEQLLSSGKDSLDKNIPYIGKWLIM